MLRYIWCVCLLTLCKFSRRVRNFKDICLNPGNCSQVGCVLFPLRNRRLYKETDKGYRLSLHFPMTCPSVRCRREAMYVNMGDPIALHAKLYSPYMHKYM